MWHVCVSRPCRCTLKLSVFQPLRAGDYLKTRRALLRSVEKQAMQAERLDGLRSAVDSGNLADAASLLKRAQVRGGAVRTLRILH